MIFLKFRQTTVVTLDDGVTQYLPGEIATFTDRQARQLLEVADVDVVTQEQAQEAADEVRRVTEAARAARPVAELVPVKFRAWQTVEVGAVVTGYGVGEVAFFPKEQAEAFVAAGAADRVAL